MRYNLPPPRYRRTLNHMNLYKLGIPLPAPLWTHRHYWKHYFLSKRAVKIARLLKKLWDFSQFFLANRSRSHAWIFRMNLPFERTNTARSHIASLLRCINRFMVCLDYPTPKTIQKWVVYGGAHTAHRDINTDSHWVLRQFISICVCLGLCACLTPLASPESIFGTQLPIDSIEHWAGAALEMSPNISWVS